MDKDINAKKLETEIDSNETPKERSNAEKEAAAAVMAIIELTGTHTSSTETDSEDADAGGSAMAASTSSNANRNKHVSFDDIGTTENVKEFAQVLKENPIERKEKVASVKTLRTTPTMGQKRKRITKKLYERSEAEGGERGKVTTKRKRRDVGQTNLCGVHMGKKEKVEKSLRQRELEPRSEPEPSNEPKPKESKPKNEENLEIAERFRRIMDMFDSFTKNLESFENVTIECDDPLTDIGQIVEERTAKKEENSKKRVYQDVPKKDEGENIVEEAVNVEEIQTPTQKVTEPEEVSSVKANTDYIIDIEDLDHPDSEAQKLPQLQHIGAAATELPKWRQGLHYSPKIAADAQKDSANSTRSDKPNVSISCQTSIRKHVVPFFESLKPNALKEVEPTEATGMSDQKLQPNDLPPKLSKMALKAIDVPPTNESGCRVDTFIVGPKIPTPPNMPPSPFHGDPFAATSISQQTLVKVSPSPSMLELPQSTDRNFHTIHIDTTSSPTSSVMRRAPLCMRCWRILADLFSAVCLCLQVNKDCIFCLGFFVVFVVSASFLTAFFYRTLSINPQFFQTAPTQSLSLSASPPDPGFYYY